MFNETKFYDEKATYRAVTGGAYNFPQADGTILKGDGTPSGGGSFPAKGTIPIAKLYTGTMDSNDKIVLFSGMSKADFELLKPGDYLYNGDAEVRAIKNVLSSFQVELVQEFSSDLSSNNILVCERQFFKSIYAMSTHDTDSAILQEAPFRPGDHSLNGGAPISYDATSGEISFQVSK